MALVHQCEEKLVELEKTIEKDFDHFLKHDLLFWYHNFLRSGGDLQRLEEELHYLTQPRICPSAHAWVFANEWCNQLYGKKVVSTSAGVRDLLNYLYSDFEGDEEFWRWISNRFDLPLEELIKKENARVILDWMVLWMTDEYPQIALFLFGRIKIAKFQFIKSIDLEQLILYLPQFILWGLGDNLEKAQDRFIIRKLGMGCNARHIKAIPMALNKRMAHHFHNAPKEAKFNDAFWYALVLGMHGDVDLLNGLKQYFQDWNRDLEFLKTLIVFFAKPGNQVRTEELPRLLGYLRHLQDENEEVSLRGWTIRSLRRRTREWYAELDRIWALQRARMEEENLRKINAMRQTSWKGADYSPFELASDEGTYKIIQLTTAKELRAEGGVMRHCVGGYVSTCVLHGTSIWSLRKENKDACKHLVTIEINKGGKVIQAKGKMNAAPKKEYWKLIREWADREGISLGLLS